MVIDLRGLFLVGLAENRIDPGLAGFMAALGLDKRLRNRRHGAPWRIQLRQMEADNATVRIFRDPLTATDALQAILLGPGHPAFLADVGGLFRLAFGPLHLRPA